MAFVLTTHARHAVQEREIALAWIERALNHPERVEKPSDGTVHPYSRSLSSKGVCCGWS
jgi:hypothetical protein